MITELISHLQIVGHPHRSSGSYGPSGREGIPKNYGLRLLVPGRLQKSQSHAQSNRQEVYWEFRNADVYVWLLDESL
jgi:hypothetical protein